MHILQMEPFDLVTLNAFDQIRSIRNMNWMTVCIFNSQDLFEKQKIKEDKFLWVSFVIFLVLRAMHTICLYAVCLNYACISHVLLNIFFYLQNLQGHIFNFFSTYKKHFLQKWLFIFITCPGVRWILYTHVLGWSLGGINQSF
jgi:hypothetical protein